MATFAPTEAKAIADVNQAGGDSHTTVNPSDSTQSGAIARFSFAIAQKPSSNSLFPNVKIVMKQERGVMTYMAIKGFKYILPV